MPTMDRSQGWSLLNEYTANVALIRHGQCVEAAMRSYAAQSGGDVEQWGLAGLLHDFDYERWPTPPQHTREGAAILRSHGCDEEVVGAILSHVPWNLDEYPRDRPLRCALFACDELCGFLYACALVRPERLLGLEPRSVIKKLKQKSFAAAVSREDIHNGAALLQIPLDGHIAQCIAALQSVAHEIGLSPDQAS